MPQARIAPKPTAPRRPAKKTAPRGSEPTTARGERRQEAFLAAAEVVFLEHGFAAASVEDVLRRVGGSKASLYRYFGSKEGLFTAMVQARCEEFMRGIAVPERVETNLAETLEQFGMRFFTHYGDPGRVRLLRAVMAEAARFPALSALLYEQVALRIRRQLARLFADCTRQGLMQAPDPDLTAVLFVELIKGHTQFRCLMGLSPLGVGGSPNQFVRAAVQLFLEGCGSRGGA